MRSTRLIIIACLVVCVINIRTAENTLDNPNIVVPVASEMTIAGTEFSYSFNPHSLTILRLPVTTN